MIRGIRATVLLLAAAAQAAAVCGSAGAAESALSRASAAGAESAPSAASTAGAEAAISGASAAVAEAAVSGASAAAAKAAISRPSATGGGPAIAGIDLPRVTVRFIPASPAFTHAARDYEAIWDEYGDRIVRALERRTCLHFSEATVSAVVDDDVSNSGGPEHAMLLRATYPHDLKQAALVHELGHRHLWQLARRLDGLDGHETLYLVLDLVWADVWGERFAKDSVDRESRWDGGYDYRAAWGRARSLSAKERARLWNELLAQNGFPSDCKGIVDRGG